MTRDNDYESWNLDAAVIGSGSATATATEAEAAPATETPVAERAAPAPVRTPALAVAERPVAPEGRARIVVEELRAGFGKHEVLKGLSFRLTDRAITAVMGPSGCGKSTFIRCVNRLHEETVGAWVKGRIRIDGWDVYAPGVDPVALRRRVGMVFQRPNPFPTFSIYDNLAVGLRLHGVRKRAALDERVERALRRAALWEEVKDRLKRPGTSLSGGQQQRLCIARALSVEPEIVLLDEPTSALDPIATERIEELLCDLKKDYTLVLVTHNIQQAARVADRTLFFLLGELVEEGPTSELFTTPRDPRTESFISGRFG